MYRSDVFVECGGEGVGEGFDEGVVAEGEEEGREFDDFLLGCGEGGRFVACRFKVEDEEVLEVLARGGLLVYVSTWVNEGLIRGLYHGGECTRCCLTQALHDSNAKGALKHLRLTRSRIGRLARRRPRVLVHFRRLAQALS